MFGGFIKRLADKEAEKVATQKIQAFSSIQIGEGISGKLYAEVNELVGFRFIKFYTLGSMAVNRMNGGNVILRGNSFTLHHQAENIEILSDVSESLKLSLTEIEIEVTTELVDAVNNNLVNEITFKFGSKEYAFSLSGFNTLKEIVNSK